MIYRVLALTAALAGGVSQLTAGWHECTVNLTEEKASVRVISIARCTFALDGTTAPDQRVSLRGTHTVDPGGGNGLCLGEGYCGSSVSVFPYNASTLYVGNCRWTASQLNIDFASIEATNSLTTDPPQRPRSDEECGAPGALCENGDNCGGYCSPIVIDVNGDGYALTDAAHGATFDMNGDGVLDRIGWTERGGDDSFLWLDTNGNGVVDGGKELFGNAEYANGFEKLSISDDASRGGNGDGTITSSDAIWETLRLWTDVDHDGVSEPGEISSLSATRFVAISLKYQTIGKRDGFGNLFRFKGRIVTNAERDEKLYDVIFVSR